MSVEIQEYKRHEDAYKALHLALLPPAVSCGLMYEIGCEMCEFFFLKTVKKIVNSADSACGYMYVAKGAGLVRYFSLA
jgi:hypothetical protein